MRSVTELRSNPRPLSCYWGVVLLEAGQLEAGVEDVEVEERALLRLHVAPVDPHRGTTLAQQPGVEPEQIMGLVPSWSTPDPATGGQT